MRREYVIGGLIVLIVLFLGLKLAFWEGKTGGESHTIVSVSEGTVEVINAADPHDLLILRPGEQVASTKGLLYGIVPIPTPTQTMGIQIIPAPTPSSASLDSIRSKSVSTSTPKDSTQPIPRTAKDRYWIAGYVKAQNDQPIANCRMVLHEMDGVDRGVWYTSEDEGKLAGVVMTNKQGYYMLSVDGPHQFQLSSIPPKDYLVLWERVVLTDSQKTLTKDFIHPEAKLSVKGRVVNSETNEPIEGAQITVISRQVVQSNLCIEIGKSDSDGQFEIPRLVQGVYRLEATAKGFIRFDPYDKSLKHAGEFLNIDVSPQNQGKEHILRMNPGFSATVRVLDWQQRPVADAELYYMRNTEGFAYAGFGRTNAQGMHEAGELPHESLVVRVKKISYGSEISEVFQPSPQDRSTPITLTLSPPGSISGKVMDAKNRAVSGRIVFAQWLGIPQWEKILFEKTATDASGFYTVADLSPGKYRVLLYKNEWDPNPEQSRDVELNPAEPLSGIDFTIGDTAETRGQVIDQSGNPLEEIHVLAMVYQENENQGYGSAYTDAEGKFLIAHLPMGDTIQFQIEDSSYATLIERVPMNSEYTVLTVKPSGSIRGIVVDEHRKPIAQAKIWPIRDWGFADTSKAVVSKSDGSFVVKSLDAGTYQLGVNAEIYSATQTSDLNVQEGEIADAGMIVLQEGLDISGLYTDSHNQPIAGATIRLQRLSMDSSSLTLSATSDGNGRYAFSALEPGLYQVEGMGEGDGHLRIFPSQNFSSQNFLEWISFPYNGVQQPGLPPRLQVELKESVVYSISLQTPNSESIQPPIYCEKMDSAPSFRQEIPLRTEGSTISLRVPKGIYPLRLLVPGYLPVEFDPEALADPSAEGDVRNLTLKLIAP